MYSPQIEGQVKSPLFLEPLTTTIVVVENVSFSPAVFQLVQRARLSVPSFRTARDSARRISSVVYAML